MSDDAVGQSMKSGQSLGGSSSAGEPSSRQKRPATASKKPPTRATLAQVPQIASEEAFCDTNLRKAAYYADDNVLIFNMDVREAMGHLAAAGVIVNCMVTSPPFYGQRDYGAKGQIGLEDHPQRFIEQLVDCFEAAKPVLADNGSLWVINGCTSSLPVEMAFSTASKFLFSVHRTNPIG